MGLLPKGRRIDRWTVLSLAIAASIFCATLNTGRPVQANSTKRPQERSIQLGDGRPGSLYALSLGVKDPAQLQGNDAVRVTVKDAQGEIESKWLHAADLDFYLTLRPRAAGPVTVSLSSSSTVHVPEISAHLAQDPAALGPVAVERPEPIAASSPRRPTVPGKTLSPSNWVRPFMAATTKGPTLHPKAKMPMRRCSRVSNGSGSPFMKSSRRLVYFVLNVTDRDVPLDVDIFQLGKDAAGQPDVVPFTDGEFVYQIEATQNYPGLYKFRTRILQPGQEYYVRVAANHPAYQLHTYDYSVPPYTDPHEAVRTGMDFLINMGDTWLSNTPRRGAVALRTTMQHSETQLCIACHPSQFTTRGYLTAVQNGYAPTQRPALEFLTDRIYNNARPLYGEPNTNWVRVIYTARTEASRLPLIAHAFEQNVTHDPPRKNFDLPYAEFLKIHYKGVTTMPGDETDGCEPDVSPFEIATQSWQTFDLVYTENTSAGMAGRARPCRTTGHALRAEEHDRLELEDPVPVGDQPRRNTPRKSTS